jgi:alpha-ketoglutarate-dependent taurine dioxygenase
MERIMNIHFADAHATIHGDHDFVLQLEARTDACRSQPWFHAHRQALLSALDRYGAMMLRGFLDDDAQFEALMDLLVPEPFEMLDVVTPRSHVRNTMYTSTQAHPSIDIPQHQEMSYHSHPPWYLGFYCEVPSAGDGLTPVNDLRRFTREARQQFPAVVERFRALGVVFVRNFNKFNYKSWQTCWESSTHEQAEAKLRAAETEFEWVDRDWLRTFQRRPAVLRDPLTGDDILYPSLNIFHRSFLEHIAAPQNVPLPSNESEQSLAAYFGDGSAIPEDFHAWLRERTRSGRVSIPWQPRDCLIVNNLIAGHGRTPYSNPHRSLLASFRGTIDLQAAAHA